jgi:predicted dehydrogenase
MSGIVRLGLVGCGSRGIGVGRLFRDHPACQVTALMDLYPAPVERAEAALELSGARRFTDFDALLREAPVDALLLTCDPTAQVQLACRAMETGRHVCTEVPAAFTLEECWNLIGAVEKTGCKYQLMEQTRYWGFVEVWRQMRERGEFGHVCFAQGEYIHFEPHWNNWVDLDTGEQVPAIRPPAGRRAAPTWRYRLWADPIYYLPHTLSPLLRILDDRVVSVSCVGTRVGSYTYPEEKPPFREIEYALMHTAGDTVMAVGAGFTLPYVQRGMAGCHWYEVRGTQASVESPRCRDDRFRVWRPGMESYAAMDLSTAPLDADALQAGSGHGGADFKPVDTFLRAILDDGTPPVDAYLAAEITAPAVLAAESARLGGRRLEVPDFRRRTG